MSNEEVTNNENNKELKMGAIDLVDLFRDNEVK